MPRFMVAGRSAATSATLDHVGAQLWNPHTTLTLIVEEVSWAKTVATADHVQLIRSTARGTAGSTVTPDIDNDVARGLAPASGAVLDLAAFSVQPTLAGPPFWRWNLPAAVGSGFILPLPGEIQIPPGTGLCIGTPVGTILQPADVSIRWRS